LHGEESPQHVKAVSKYLPVIKVLPADKAATIAPLDYEVSAFMLDTPAAERGGTGRLFDWTLAVDFQARLKGKPLVLSGGLSPENVAKAIATVHPYAVDVASGVEASPGRKDHAKLRDFIQICKSL
jgi:phosphoribosylanthranilate isomerase